jgi:SAM-dependent methyltransferase
MNEVIRHYDELLAQHYSWMIGSHFDSKVAEQQALLCELGVRNTGGLAIDLGCGPGYQAVALARLGFSVVIAVDSSQLLLDELAGHIERLPIKPTLADMRDLNHLAAADSVSVIACMGDTLTHLSSVGDVRQLLADAHAVLAPGGLLALTFRDLSVERKDLDRFLPVRGDVDRIMTCVLDFEPETVVVNDLIYVREGDGWAFHKGSYRKIRLGVEEVIAILAKLGFTVWANRLLPGGMQAIGAVK